MAITTDVKAKTLAATGAAGVGRTRVRGIYYIATVGAGTVSFKSGGAGGEELILVATPAANLAGQVFIPAEGVLFPADPYVTLTNVTSVTFFYG